MNTIGAQAGRGMRGIDGGDQRIHVLGGHVPAELGMDATGIHRRGAFVDPTVFDNGDPSMRVAREEIFGPVLGVIPVDGVDEALAIARDTDYGPHATLFTRDIDKAFHLAKRLPCGTVAINGFSEGNVTTPFGGYKPSGSTARDNGTEAMDRYLQTKTIWLSLR